ncbi:putative ABC transporter ATP-binding protein [Fusobacterium necrophorum]|nr:ABC transporter ATP-binding protein [Fusobacterium necrophorum]MBR8823579.1 putative ABC transporter ATP-binding protein [Fusobacterium necrophorum]
MKTKKKKTLNVTELFQLLKMIFQYYPILFPTTLVCTFLNPLAGTVSSVFIREIIAVIEKNTKRGEWNMVSLQLLPFLYALVGCYLFSLTMALVSGQLMAVITPGILKKIRGKMFSQMQKLPIQYFDKHSYGEIMSHYTNDVDSLRQLVSQGFPQLFISFITAITVLSIMLYYCLWLTFLVLIAVIFISMITQKIGRNSIVHFSSQQNSLGKLEGFIEERINGQKIIQTLCQEEKNKHSFDTLNDTLFQEAKQANTYTNILNPILNSTGNFLYVIIVITGAFLLYFHIPNLSISGLPISMSIIIPFLNLSKTFSGSVNQVSQQMNAVASGIAGMKRISSLLKETTESDVGEVTLIRTENSENSKKIWTWKYRKPGKTLPYYKELRGEIHWKAVKFEYEEGKAVLENISLHVQPGKKIALVGATGAGKTTIANLLNRFYDVTAGEIYYDGINIQKISKKALRHSLGMVLQDTHLFTGSILENIRYGRLEATEEECISIAKLIGANDFISRLPEGYHTFLSETIDTLSTGQRQLIAIARAAIADPPIMILDEATSSIDTKTENIIQRAMEILMQGRTVFIIAHRLSTVKSADLILVLEKGHIIEQGNHASLMAQKGQYYQLYTSDFELELPQ